MRLLFSSSVQTMPATLLERIFSTLDVNSNGVINTREFVQGLSVACRGTVKEKVQTRGTHVWDWSMRMLSTGEALDDLNERLHDGEQS